jgi:hypothetical protein
MAMEWEKVGQKIGYWRFVSLPMRKDKYQESGDAAGKRQGSAEGRFPYLPGGAYQP